MSGVTASKEDEEATAKEMEDTMEDTTWSIDVLPIPQPSDVEPQEPAPDGVPPLPVAETSSGCQCDPTAKCALQGQPFTWCRVGSEEEPTCAKLDVAEDPTGRDHALGVKGRQWDYCVPPAPVKEEEGNEGGESGGQEFQQWEGDQQYGGGYDPFGGPTGYYAQQGAGHDQPGHTLPGSFYDQFGGLGGGQGQFGGAGYDQVGYDTQGVTGYDPYTGAHFDQTGGYDQPFEDEHGGEEEDEAPEEELTSHLGCECAPRPDVLDRYMDDPLFHNLETGEIDIEKIPFKDRIAVEAMQNYQENGGDLCQQTPHSGEFLVCPAAKGCAGSNVAGPGGALPSGWFSGVSGKSWDFCAPAARPAESEEPGEGEPGFDQTGNAQYGYDQQYGAYGQQAMHYQCVPGAVTFLVVALHQLQRSSKSAKKGSFL